MKSPYEITVDAIARIVTAGVAKAMQDMAPPAEPVSYIEVPPQRSLPPAPPGQQFHPPPVQAGAQPDPNYPPFPFPPPLQLPSAEVTQPALPNSQQQQPKKKLGRPPKDKTASPRLLTDGRNQRALPPVNGRNGHEEGR